MPTPASPWQALACPEPMCLVAIAWQAHPRYPLILAGNRDEYHARPAAAADWWPDAPAVFGGRDLKAGGSWLGINRNGRLAVVTNNPLRPSSADRPLSRGALVRDWLTGSVTSTRYLDDLATREAHYGGFSLLVGNVRTGLEGFITPAGAWGSRWTVPTGISVLSNSSREAPWPKVTWLERQLSACLANPERRAGATTSAGVLPGSIADPLVDELMALLGRRMPVATADDDSLLAGVRVRPFVSGLEYGTRASTVILADPYGGWSFCEQRYGPGGVPVGNPVTARHSPP